MNQMFLAASNLTSDSLSPCVPWEFKITEEIPLQIRKDKLSRQDWYKTPSVVHQFYTGIEPLNPNIRISKKDNPPLNIKAFVADFDLPITDERAKEVIATMPIKPTYIERSLGGNLRLVWTLAVPIRVDSYDFCVFLHDKAIKWLSLGLLPGLDEPAFKEPTRLYCNGGVWAATGHGPVVEILTQPFLFECAKRFSWPEKEETVIPLDAVYAELLKKYPNMDWPSDFSVGSKGPSFWVEGSTSTGSAIVKPGGMYSFAAHAAKSFTPWDDDLLLGSEFCKNFKNESITKATSGVFFDGRKFWMKFSDPESGDAFQAMEAAEMNLHLEVACRLSTKPVAGGPAPLKAALHHIMRHNRVKAALPYAFHPPGPMRNDSGDRVLNIYNARCIPPAEGVHEWGPNGSFPDLSEHFDTFFTTPEQLHHFLAWWQYFYKACLYHLPLSGQNIFLFGGVGIGKTMTGRLLVGGSVGGFADASDFLINNISFNAHLFKAALWVLDDEAPSNTEASMQRFLTIVKKIAANSEFLYNEKFLTSAMLPFSGRVIITANLDFISSRALSGMDNNSLDKTHLFKCVAKRDFKFPDRLTWAKKVAVQLPRLLSWLLAYQSPSYVKPDSRFGYEPHHEQSLLDQGYQTGRAAGFKECLVKMLTRYFIENPTAEYFEGTSIEILQLMKAETGDILKANVDTVNRSMDFMMKENSLNITTSTSAQHNLRLFRIPNFLPKPQPPVATEPPKDNDTPNKFQGPTAP